VEALFASYIVGIVGVSSVGAKILWGTLSDRIGREVTHTIGVCCSICGMIFLIVFAVHPFSPLPYFYGVFFGMGYAVSSSAWDTLFCRHSLPSSQRISLKDGVMAESLDRSYLSMEWEGLPEHGSPVSSTIRWEVTFPSLSL
jgi:MFS family permease